VLIPHFVEHRPDSPPARPAGTAEKTIIVAGFIFGTKGHQVLLDAMPLLPGVRVAFVGGASAGAGGSGRHDAMFEVARRHGVGDWLEVTGYLPEEEYQRRLAEADLAVCPFYPHKSASGSLSSLIAADCPVLASDIP